jgi:3-oxoacyl-[acyl-carrier-protein] synthase-3
MKGKQVFSFAVKEIPSIFNALLKTTKLTKKDISYLIPHQSNKKIIISFLKRVDFPKDKVLCNLENIGNTSSASIVIALDEFKERFKKDDNICLLSYGAGLSSVGCILKW